jgi:tetratricopeptide (TPR) repeat protein
MRLCFIFLICCSISFGQKDLNAEIESLKDSVLKYKHSKPDKALNFGFEVLKIADLSNPTESLISVYYRIGEILFYRGLEADAIGFYDQSLKLFEALPLNKRHEKNIKLPPWVLLNIGNIYFKNNDYDKAKLKYVEALDNFNLYEDNINKNFGLSTVYDNLGSIEELNGDFNSAEKYYNKAYERKTLK